MMSFDDLSQMTEEDFRAVVQAIDEECIRRGWPCCPWEQQVPERAKST